jgi:hypothetical protein
MPRLIIHRITGGVRRNATVSENANERPKQRVVEPGVEDAWDVGDHPVGDDLYHGDRGGEGVRADERRPVQPLASSVCSTEVRGV